MLGLISIILWIATIIGYIIYNLFQKNTKLETIVQKQDYQLRAITQIINESNKILEQTELTQAFKSDDQIGAFFNNLKIIQESLNEFKNN
jgi:hypothetical protein